MAQMHGKPGRYAKSQSWERLRRMVFGMCLFAGVFGILIGVTLMNAYGARRIWISALTLLGAAVMYRLLVRRMEPMHDAMARERIKYLRGAQGEALVGWLLNDLPNAWHVFHGLKLDHAADIDHVVVGPRGVFCISTKSSRGLYEGTFDGLLHNGKPCEFAREALRQTMDLQKRMSAMLQGNVPWVQPVLAAPLGFIQGPDACGGKVWLAHQDSLTDRIAPEGKPATLDKAQVARVVKVLEMLYADAASVVERREQATAA